MAPDVDVRGSSDGQCRAEVDRLNRIIQALMDRAERSTSIQGSDFTLFQTAVMLEDRVRSRTQELEAALRQNEAMTRALRESEARFRAVVSQSLMGIAIIERGTFSYTNDKFDLIFGYDSDEISTLGPLDVVAPGDQDLVAEMIRRRTDGESYSVAYTFQGLRKDGTKIDIECHGSRMDARAESRGEAVLISSILDITERIRAERELGAIQEQLREQAIRDALTGCYNRRYLEESLGQELTRAERAGRCVSLIMADIDHFKAVNDIHGHLAGDEVLRQVGSLLGGAARASDITCRYGGEEFIVLLPEMAEHDAMVRAEQIRTAIERTLVTWNGVQISVTASLGVAVYPQHGSNPDELIGTADDAMYAAKLTGRNRVSVARSGGPSGRLRPPAPPPSPPSPESPRRAATAGR